MKEEKTELQTQEHIKQLVEVIQKKTEKYDSSATGEESEFDKGE